MMMLTSRIFSGQNSLSRDMQQQALIKNEIKEFPLVGESCGKHQFVQPLQVLTLSKSLNYIGDSDLLINYATNYTSIQW